MQNSEVIRNRVMSGLTAIPSRQPKQSAANIMVTMPGRKKMLWRGLLAYAAFAVVLLAGCQRNISG